MFSPLFTNVAFACDGMVKYSHIQQGNSKKGKEKQKKRKIHNGYIMREHTQRNRNM